VIKQHNSNWSRRLKVRVGPKQSRATFSYFVPQLEAQSRARSDLYFSWWKEKTESHKLNQSGVRQ